MGYPELTAEGLLTRDAIAFYELRAMGGAAVITVGEAVVHYATGKSHGRSINLQHPDVLAGLTNLARAIKRHGAAASIELAHGGKFSAVDRLPGERVRENVKYGPVDETLPDGSSVIQMPREVIKEIVESYGRAAALVKRAGFDMLLVHGGHGWLIEQFYSPATNTRTDEYGGSRENRARLAIEILDSIRASVGKNFPVEFRMSAEESFEGGYRLDEAVEFARLIENRIDLLHVSAGSNEDSFYETHPSMFMERGCNVRFAEEIKKHVSIPVGAIGALNEPGMMEDIIRSGRADVVYMARALLADPELPRKIIQNRTDEILKCVRCFTCLAERMQTQTRICAVNPLIGREYEGIFGRPLTSSKKVLVAGGGVGGMETAITAASRGHRVILCEKSSVLGGALNAEKRIPFKKDVFDIISTLKRRLELSGAEIRLNTEVTAEYVRREEPDVLIVAVGAEPYMPIKGKNVISAGDIDTAEIGKTVVVLGGGLVGCETAVYLAMKGHEVTLAEMTDRVAADANARQRPALMEKLNALCRVVTGVKGLYADEYGLVCENGVALKAETVIIAAGMRPLHETVDMLRNTAPEVRFVGDCIKAANIREAIFSGYHAGMDI
jgi:2,4-dienoyl-CoA reductase-like NADH-dependent reductase (Old Yellow Enzyme family)/thioredoxin reductase